MNSSTLRALHCTFLLISFGVLNAQKVTDHNTVAEQLAEKINSASVVKSPMRLAIVTFAPLQTDAGRDNTYGEYLTESIIGHLAAHSEKVKVFERKRLDAILKENELMLSGMMKPSEALRIGELIPIDALFSGTYTKLKSYIEVSGRLIDVTSGEILMSYSGRVKLSKNLKTLFPAETTPAVANTDTPSSTPAQLSSDNKDPKESAEVICKRKTESFNAQLHNLSTSDRVDHLVADAMLTPFEEKCGKLHYYFIQSLSRYNLYPTAYKAFLLETLDTISYPSGDDRAHAILSYVAHDGMVDDREWRSGLQTLRKIGDYTLSTYIGILSTNINKPAEAELQNRLDQFFAALIKGEVGLPRAIDYSKGFFEVMEGLNKNPSLRLYVYGKYSDNVETESDRVVNLHFMYLKKMYDDASDRATKTQIIEWVARYFQKHYNKKSPDQLFDFAYNFDRVARKEGNDTEQEFPIDDLKLLITRCKEKFSSYAIETPYASQKEDRIRFCVRYGIPVKGEIPSLQEADAILKEKDVKEQLRVMKLLSLMGDQVRPLENSLIALLRRKSLEEKETLLEVQSLAIDLLGAIQTHDDFAIKEMIARLTSFNYREADAAKNALTRIGKPAVHSLVERLKTTTAQDGGLQYKLIVILGSIGNDAKPAAPILRTMLGKTLHQDVRYAIEAALQEME